MHSSSLNGSLGVMNFYPRAAVKVSQFNSLTLCLLSFWYTYPKIRWYIPLNSPVFVIHPLLMRKCADRTIKWLCWGHRAKQSKAGQAKDTAKFLICFLAILPSELKILLFFAVKIADQSSDCLGLGKDTKQDLKGTKIIDNCLPEVNFIWF